MSKTVRDMIGEKLKKRQSYSVYQEQKGIENRMDYETAKKNGAVKEMLRHKFGFYRQQDTEDAYNELIREMDIISIMKEYREIEGKIQRVEDSIQAYVDKLKSEYDEYYNNKIDNYLKNGGSKHGYKHSILQQEYFVSPPGYN